MASYGCDYHNRATPDYHDGVRDLAKNARNRIEQNASAGKPWWDALPDASDYPDTHADYRRTYTRAARSGYAAMARWLAARGYPVAS